MMTHANIEIQGRNYLLTLDGHAGYNPGRDIVCAGISAIVYTLAGYLYNAGDHVNQMKNNILTPGHVCILCSGDAFVREAYRMAAIGLAQIAAEYPDHLTIMIKIDNEKFGNEGANGAKGWYAEDVG